MLFEAWWLPKSYFNCSSYHTEKQLIFCYEDTPHNATKGNNIYLRKTVSKDSCFMVALYYCDAGTELLNNVRLT